MILEQPGGAPGPRGPRRGDGGVGGCTELRFIPLLQLGPTCVSRSDIGSDIPNHSGRTENFKPPPEKIPPNLLAYLTSSDLV